MQHGLQLVWKSLYPHFLSKFIQYNPADNVSHKALHVHACTVHRRCVQSFSRKMCNAPTITPSVVPIFHQFFHNLFAVANFAQLGVLKATPMSSGSNF